MTKHSISGVGVITLINQLGDLHVRTRFTVLKNLAVDVPQGMTFIDRRLSTILLVDRKIMRLYSRSVIIFSLTKYPTGDAIILSDVLSEDEDAKTAIVWVERAIEAQAESESNVVWPTSGKA